MYEEKMNRVQVLPKIAGCKPEKSRQKAQKAQNCKFRFANLAPSPSFSIGSKFLWPAVRRPVKVGQSDLRKYQRLLPLRVVSPQNCVAVCRTQ
jgi:hypothetical protein